MVLFAAISLLYVALAIFGVIVVVLALVELSIPLLPVKAPQMPFQMMFCSQDRPKCASADIVALAAGLSVLVGAGVTYMPVMDRVLSCRETRRKNRIRRDEYL